MENHKVGDLLLFRDRFGKKTLGYIDKIEEGEDRRDTIIYYCFWFNVKLPGWDDISMEMPTQIDQLKSNLEEYLRGIRD